jgi:hypothetical protein
MTIVDTVGVCHRGETWPNVSSVISAWGTDVCRDDPNLMIFGTYSGGVSYLSTDGGATFNAVVVLKGEDSLVAAIQVPKLMKRYPQAWPGYSAADMMDNRFAPPEMLPDITELLISKGYADSDVRGILGENFLRVARQVWK